MAIAWRVRRTAPAGSHWRDAPGAGTPAPVVTVPAVWTDNSNGTATITVTTDVASYLGIDIGTVSGTYTQSALDYTNNNPNDPGGPLKTTSHTFTAPEQWIGTETLPDGTYYFRVSVGTTLGNMGYVASSLEQIGVMSMGVLVNMPMTALPEHPAIVGAGVFSSALMNASADVLSVVFQIPKTGTIDKVHYRVGIAATPNLTRRIEMRTVNSGTGKPNAAGTLYGSSTSITDSVPVTTNTNMSAALAVTATAGDVVALVFDISSYTSGQFNYIDGRGNTNTRIGTAGGRYSNFPYSFWNLAGVDTIDSDPMTTFALEYSGGVFVPVTPGLGWVGTGIAMTVQSATGTVRRAGNKYTAEVSRRAVGFYILGNLAGSCVLRLRDSDGSDTILATATPVATELGSTLSGSSTFMFDAGATVSITRGHTYYITLEAVNDTASIVYSLSSGHSVAMLDTMPGGQGCFGVTNSTAYNADGHATWTNLTTADAVQRMNIGLMTDQQFSS